MTRLSQTPAGARLQRGLLAKGLTRNPRCPVCEREYPPEQHAIHRQLCGGKKEAATDRESVTAERARPQ